MNTLVIVTKNSTYKLELCPEGFKVTKTEEARPNYNGIHVGWSRTGMDLYLRKGEPMEMGGLRTTPVIEIIPCQTVSCSPTETK